MVVTEVLFAVILILLFRCYECVQCISVFLYLYSICAACWGNKWIIIVEVGSPVISDSSSWRECGSFGLWAARVQDIGIRAFTSSDRGATVQVRIWLVGSVIGASEVVVCNNNVMITETLRGLQSSSAVQGTCWPDRLTQHQTISSTVLVTCFGFLVYISHPKASSVHLASIQWPPS